MGTHVIKLPDVGEGVAEAEFVELHVKVGDEVGPDDNLADVMTDKATVEIPSPRKGKVIWIGPAVGEIVSVGSEIIKLEVEGKGNTSGEVAEDSMPEPKPAAKVAQPDDVAQEMAIKGADEAPAPAAKSGSNGAAPAPWPASGRAVWSVSACRRALRSYGRAGPRAP
jgi:2-oxoisovalerate dehydrogenase E2 component (dihydrolipoyl transacylase)